VIHLREKLLNALPGAAVTLLYGLGMMLALLKVTELMAFAGMAAAILAAVTLLLTLASLDHRTAWLVGIASAAAGGIWLVMGGAAMVMDVMQALVLHANGLHTALPLVAGEAAAISSVLCGVAAFFVTQRNAGAYPALVLWLLAVVLMWLSDRTELMWYLLPAVVAVVTLLLQGNHEISALRVLPLATVSAALAFGCVAAGGAVIPPLKEAADGLRRYVFDMILFTGNREVFSLADVGYYPQGEDQLGGPAEPSKEPVMAVITPRQVYLRGSIRNTYTGRDWKDEVQSKRYPWDSAAYADERSAAFDMLLPAASDPRFGQLLSPRTVIVRMLGPSATSLFAPQRVRSLTTESRIDLYFNKGSEIFNKRSLNIEDVWTVEAPLMIAGEDGVATLIAACERSDDPNWAFIRSNYLKLPDHMQQEVWTIADLATAGARTPYETALALQDYLSSRYTYTLDAPEQSPEQDFVTAFLLQDERGYCTHFASAMTVLCRMAGLPARYVEGFVATPDATGLAVVTGEQGHAWTEVYFNGFGWLTFDATPAGIDVEYLTPDQLTAPETNEAEPTATPEAPVENEPPTPSPSATPTPTPEPETPTPVPQAGATQPPNVPTDAPKMDFPWILMAGIMVIVVLTTLLLRLLWVTPTWMSLRQKKEFNRWLTWAQATHDALRQMGLIRQVNETPMAFLARVDAANLVPEVLSQLSGAESLMFYGHAVPLPEETKLARHAYEVVRQQLTRRQRLRMLFGRAFLPAGKWDITA